MRTVQLISPGDRCPSNALIGDVLDLIGEEILYITSANTSSHVSKQLEAAHFEIARDPARVRRAAGRRADRPPQRAREPPPYPHHLPCSTSIVAFHKGELVLERLGSLGADKIAEVADRHGLALTIGEAARERVPVRAGGAALPPRAAPAARRLSPLSAS